MSSITTPTSSDLPTRLAKLQNFCQALQKGEGYQQAFASLAKIDQVNIEKKFHVKDFAGTSQSKKAELLSKLLKGVTVYTKELTSKSKSHRVFQAGQAKAKSSSGLSLVAVKSGIAINPFSRVPTAVQATTIGSFLAPKDLVNFRASFKEAAKIESASVIIKKYHLGTLIETYLHRSCSELSESCKVRALHDLMSMAYSLSKIEKLPRPSSYSSLAAFFEKVEARNLIRMMGKINEARALPDLPKSIKNLKIPKDSMGTIQKAERLRGWLEQHKDFLATFNERLNLADCHLTLLPKEIGQLQALQRLDLNKNRLIALPKEIGQLKALTGLKLDHNCLTDLPKEIGQLQALRVLVLSKNHFIALPKEIGQLKALRGLLLNENRLARLPKEIGQLHALIGLELNGNRLISLPKEICQLQTLQVLLLRVNRITALSQEICQLKALIRLDLGFNRLATLPKEIGQLKALQELDLDCNRLVTLPKEIGELQALKVLWLAWNRLTTLPKGIGELQVLKDLWLGSNRLATLPKEIGQLKALQKLYLEHNRLKDLPNEMGQLQLREFYFINNKLMSIPAGLDQFKGGLKHQSEQVLKNILEKLSSCITECRGIWSLTLNLKELERSFGKEARSQLHRCLYEVAKEAAKTDVALRKKLKDPQFARKAFVDKSIDPKLKLAAIAEFGKTYKKN